MRTLGSYTVFDADRKPLLRTPHVVKVLGPFLADMLNFRLVMADKRDETITPPPAYAFAPFYIDQDRGWVEPWNSFARMYLPDSKRILADYHSGLKPNQYYEAQVIRDRLRLEMRTIDAERGALSQTLKHLREAADQISLNYDLADFQEETQRLLTKSQDLHVRETDYRTRLSALVEERLLWLEQKNLLKAALTEMNEAFAAALASPPEVECPTCGHHYDNSLAERFGLIEDQDSMLSSVQTADAKILELDERISRERLNIDQIGVAIEHIGAILNIKRSELSFRDVVAAEGRNEAARIMKQTLAEFDSQWIEKEGLIKQQEARMSAAVSKSRSAEIRNFFADCLTRYSQALDVRAREYGARPLSSSPLARGSEGPRGLIAYYYAFLHTSRQYGGSAFCPIVIDAPNQQGQDDIHMPQIMRFINEERPDDSQLIVAAEDLFGLDSEVVDVIDVGYRKNQVLRSEDYHDVSELVRPYLGHLL